MIDNPARNYDPVAVSEESTVVAEYIAEPAEETAYQSEAELEREFISILRSQAYEQLPIHTEDQLLANLRTQLERLNNVQFSDAEWTRFFDNHVAGANDGIKEKTIRIQEDHIQPLMRDDGSTKNIRLLDKKNIHNNHLQVINQYEVDKTEGGAAYSNRYDVTILVNGLPLVHVELKRRGVDIREAFNQIDRYQRHSFWAERGLFQYVQLFVISNGTLTKYYSNTTRAQHVENSTRGGKTKTSNSYEFTSWWADANNKPIEELPAFARTFFAKRTLLNILTKFCVLTSDHLLLVMRPYQIVATERILQKITIATNYKKLGTIDAGGYVWHTTGSGKTLTSFKTAQLASRMDSVDKVLFVVDRKDLDYQTMREYDRFEKGAANSNTSTKVLKQQLEDPTARIIITTIQKLSTFLKREKNHDVTNQHVVIIFDECHRSQFGDMHTLITRSFKRYNLFGFTGTPIFAVNSTGGGNPNLRTTEQAFGEKLHTYTIVDAISDKNVLPFRVDYINTMRASHASESDAANGSGGTGSAVNGSGGTGTGDVEVSAIDREAALLAPQRITGVVSYIRTHYDQKTLRATSYEHSVVTNVAQASRGRKAEETVKAARRVKGFNALFAVSSITAAKLYYQEFARQQEGLPSDKRLRVGMIYSYGVNEATADGSLDEEGFDAERLSGDSREFLDAVIADYNNMFGTSYDTSADSFQNYYKDLSMRLKNKELDLVIVVNMFLTGFDATTMNTLFVDKNLRAHGLIQAYSRTNRILNSAKAYGNIVCFRDLEEETNKALELFGNKDARSIVTLKPFAEYYDEYAEKVTELLDTYPLGERIVGEQAQKEFIALFGAILRLQNILTAFDNFAGNEILSEREAQDYRSRYLDLYNDFRRNEKTEKENINDDVVFEIELVKQVGITVDYILLLVEKYRESHGDGEDAEIRAQITRAVDSSPQLRNKKDLVEEFVDSVTVTTAVDEAWPAYVRRKMAQELNRIIEGEKLKADATWDVVPAAFGSGAAYLGGAKIAKLLPPMSRFSRGGEDRKEKQSRVEQKLHELLARFDPLFVEDGSAELMQMRGA